MASAGLLALIDDIAALLDEVAILTKVAAKKTAGVLGDDLALNAEQVTGVRAERELPVVWAVAKGSALNKLILVPAALALSVFVPWLITPLLMFGGAYLCVEGFEKIFHKFHQDDDGSKHKEKIAALSNPKIDLVAFEKEKIKGAIRTDFILSAEIIVIALGVARDASFAQQAGVVTFIAAGVTVFVYGLVAGIVKLDDAGLYLLKTKEGMVKLKHMLGRALLKFCPILMKTLSIVGTAAMFLVGGGILVHGVPNSKDIIQSITQQAETLSVIGGFIGALMPTLINGIGGVIAGGIIFMLITPLKKHLLKK